MLSFFALKDSIGARIVKPLYTIVAVLLAGAFLLGGIGGLMGVVEALRAGSAGAALAPLAATLAYLVGFSIAALGWRVLCEVVLALLGSGPGARA
jgi:hypothetical protein